MLDTQRLLDELVRRLSDALGDDLVSVVLYGSAAADDFQERVSDLNVLAVLAEIGERQLEQAYGPVNWWLNRKQPAPIVLSVEEIENASDAFAIEFLDIRAAYRILHGEDLVGSIEIESAHHRHQVEHELRSLLLRLRERYLGMQKDTKALRALLTDSLPSFSTLFRHAVILDGRKTAVKKHEVFQQAAEAFGISPEPFETVLALRQGTQRVANAELRPLFLAYLTEITKMAGHVDRIDKAATAAAG
jgi:predicted nucleotidyltransferase